MKNSYKIKPASPFAQLGASIGQSLSEQIPKEVERYRLSQGLNKLGEQKNLSPFQRYAQLAGIPGITPQMIESGTRLLEQEAIRNVNQQNEQNFRNISDQKIKNQPSGTLTKEETQQAVLNPYIEPDRAQYNAMVNDFQDRTGVNRETAKAEIDAQIASEKNRNAQLQQSFSNQSVLEKNIKDNLAQVYKKYATDIPADVYQKIDSEAINSILTKDQGGKGYSPESASKIYGEKLDEIGRQYSDVKTLSPWNIADFGRRVRTLQSEFEKRKDTRNLAQEFIKNLGISPMLAYRMAEPPSSIPELMKILNEIPGEDPRNPLREGSARKYFHKLYKAMGTEGSPLAIAYELDKRNYDPAEWLNFLENNKENMTIKQVDQLGKPLIKINPEQYLKDLFIKTIGL